MENTNYQSLESIYNNYCANHFQDPDWLLKQANKYLYNSADMKNKSEKYSENVNENEDNNDNENENRQREKRFEIYNEACQFIPSTILVDQFTAANKLLSDSYNARKEFASQLGLNYAVQYLLSSSSAYANQIEICFETGNVISSSVKPNYNTSDPLIPFSTFMEEKESSSSQSVPMCVVVEEGFAGNKNIPKGGDEMEEKKKKMKENQYRSLQRNTDLPFRLTRNIVGSLSGHMLLGGTTVSLGLVMDACVGNKDVLDGCLNIFLNADVRARRSFQELLRKKEKKEIINEKNKEKGSNKEGNEEEIGEDIDSSSHHLISFNIIDIKVRSKQKKNFHDKSEMIFLVL